MATPLDTEPGPVRHIPDLAAGQPDILELPVAELFQPSARHPRHMAAAQPAEHACKTREKFVGRQRPDRPANPHEVMYTHSCSPFFGAGGRAGMARPAYLNNFVATTPAGVLRPTPFSERLCNLQL